MMALHPSEIDLTLDRLRGLLAALGHPETRLAPVIHIAGTNGKGSTQAMIRAGLAGAGHRVQAYTSPHLVQFHERIRLAAGDIPETTLTKALQATLTANAGGAMTFYEGTTAAAFHAFANDPADWLLLEVGLGGRLDATNVIDTPALTVITPVAMDHMDYLGDTLAKIAGEKAGILKRRVPCIVTRQQDEALEVIEHRAARLGVPLHVQGQHWHVTTEQGRLVFQDETGLLDLPLPALRGPHQIDNAGAALAALRVLGQTEPAFEAAVTQAHWPARMQRLPKGALTDIAPQAELWLDGGHNPAAGHALAETLKTLPPRPEILICAMMADKDAAGFLAPLAAPNRRLIATTVTDEPRSMAIAELAKSAQTAGLPTSQSPSISAALTAAARENPAARVIFCGSLFLAGEVLATHGTGAKPA
ncbi:bifunctional folylpolyglutamate synthase/dihydrofolate synthase [Alphaproteobacteria bacterium KMM 3653]|uniref:Dihydrofolate synthase/folylpolyglutamate synthase n=2 Tax=Harenicola maris TaxID=2841044 RepID=A0AAP2G8C9_9RHOB|nr:bifunctional folylpolyglutamate synthase/dihydrofolate synthase [Harenicola maris]